MTTKIIAINRKAYHDYYIEDTLETGIELVGSEVKSIRQGAVNLKDSFGLVRGGQVFIIGMHISAYDKGSHFNPEPKRDRRLLANKSEILKLKAKIEQKGYTLIPTKIYFKGSLVKIELGVARGKQLHDKRRAIKEKEQKREIERTLKEYK